MIIVADTSPLNYLIQIGHVDVLQSIYRKIVIPLAVQDEMRSSLAPVTVRTWITSPPPWLEVRSPASIEITLDIDLGAGEREAITLAHSSEPESTLIIDERLGRLEAIRLGLQIIGTLGLLEEAHHLGLLNFPIAMKRLLKTNFRASHLYWNSSETCFSNVGQTCKEHAPVRCQDP